MSLTLPLANNRNVLKYPKLRHLLNIQIPYTTIHSFFFFFATELSELTDVFSTNCLKCKKDGADKRLENITLAGHFS